MKSLDNAALLANINKLAEYRMWWSPVVYDPLEIMVSCSYDLKVKN